MTTSGGDEPTCADCGWQPIRMILGATPLCDRCYDARIAASRGWPRLSGPPSPETIVGPDGRRHPIIYRVWRLPGGIAVEAAEGDRLSTGYFAQVVGPHDADVSMLIEQVKAVIHQRVGRLDLELAPTRDHWIMTGFDLTGRLVWREDGEPYGVVIDGRSLSCEEFGRTLAPFEGWEFRLSFGDGFSGDDSPELSAADDSAGDVVPPPEPRIH